MIISKNSITMIIPSIWKINKDNKYKIKVYAMKNIIITKNLA